MEQTLKTHLLTLCGSYCESKNVSPKTVAQSACGDWRFFDRLEKGASFTIRIYDRAVRWFSKNWPDNQPWPEGLKRPEIMP